MGVANDLRGSMVIFASGVPCIVFNSLITNLNNTMILLIQFQLMFSAVLTDDAKDAQNVRGKYHQHVDEGEQNESNGSVTQPVERLGGEYHLLDGSTYLWTDTDTGLSKELIPQYHSNWALQGTNQQQTYREQYNRDGQGHSCEDSHSHTQDQSVIRVNPTVSVQQFRLYIVYRNKKRKIPH